MRSACLGRKVACIIADFDTPSYAVCFDIHAWIGINFNRAGAQEKWLAALHCSNIIGH